MKKDQLKCLIEQIELNQLKELNLNRTTGQQLIEICSVLAKNSSVQNIHLPGYDIRGAGIIALSEALKLNASVTEIILISDPEDKEFDKITDDGAIALAEVLKVNISLQVINLGWNEIADKGSRALAEALQVNRSLYKISLEGNKIEDDGASALAEALKANRSVKDISLASNQIGDDGASVLAEALKFNKYLKMVDLTVNKIGDNGASALADAIKLNVSVEEICLKGNKIGDAGATALADALDVNCSVQNCEIKIKGEIQQRIEKSLFVNSLWNDFKVLCQHSFNPLEYQQICLSLREINLNILDSYPDCISESAGMPKKVVELRTQVSVIITQVAHLMESAMWSSLADKHKALRVVVDLLGYQLEPNFRHGALELCIQQLRGIEVGSCGAPLPLISYRLLLNAARKVEPQLPPSLKSFLGTLLPKQNYDPIVAGQLMAIPEIMGCLGMSTILAESSGAPAAAASLDSEGSKPVLIDCYLCEDSQPVVLQEAQITEEGLLESLNQSSKENSLLGKRGNSLFSTDSSKLPEVKKQHTLTP